MFLNQVWIVEENFLFAAAGYEFRLKVMFSTLPYITYAWLDIKNRWWFKNVEIHKEKSKMQIDLKNFYRHWDQQRGSRWCPIFNNHLNLWSLNFHAQWAHCKMYYCNYCLIYVSILSAVDSPGWLDVHYCLILYNKTFLDEIFKTLYIILFLINNVCSEWIYLSCKSFLRD